MSYQWDEDFDWINGVDPEVHSAVYDTLFKDKAACLDADPMIFFLERGQSTIPAKKICYTCPVQKECLEYAMNLPGPTVGVWGGYSEMERKRLKRLRDLGVA